MTRLRCFRPNRHNIYKALIMILLTTIFAQTSYLLSGFREVLSNIANTSKITVLPFKYFRYPLEVDMPKLVKEYKERNGMVNETEINPFKYSFSTELTDRCTSEEPINLLLIVKSAPQNFRRRSIIRETWGNELSLKHVHIKTVFILGKPQESHTQVLIKHEIGRNGDIIQIDYEDTYYNNTIKTTGAIIWATTHCSNARFLMIADDDFYVATDFLVQHLTSLPESAYNTLFMGRVWIDTPQRNIGDRWFISVEDYHYDMYPPFVSAGATIMSMQVASDINIARRFTKHFKFDDVFLAIILYKLGIKPIHSDKIMIVYTPLIKDDNFHSVFACHGYDDPEEMRTAWEFHLNFVKSRTGKR